MAKRIVGTTPRQDGYRMPGEFEEQTGVWMLWPQRPDNWRGGAKPAQQAFADVARAIARFEPVTVCVNPDQFQNARARLPEDIRVVEMTSNDAWVRDCGPTFVKNDQGDLRAVDWTCMTGCTSPGTKTTWWPGKSASWRGWTATAPTVSCWRAGPSMWTARARC